ncbi:MAG: Trk system potassium transporter TrkA [Planctomycetota bacterium]
MHILIVGMGEVGFHLAKVLSAEKHSVTVVDPDPTKIKRVSEALDVQVFCGDASLPGVLDGVDAASQDLVLCVSSSDRVNMLTCLIAKRMGATSTIVRVRDPEPYRNYRTFLRKNLGFADMLSLEDLAAQEISKIVRRNQAVAVENFLDGQVTLRVIPVKAESPLLANPLKDQKLPGNLLVVAVRREGKTLIPDGNQEFLVDDEVYVLGFPSSVEEFERNVGMGRGRTRNVVILGTSGVAFQAARSLLRLGVKLRMLSDDREACELFADKLDDVTVLHVDGNDLDVFKEEHIGKADAFVGASKDDERNLLACLVARELGCKRTIALVSRPDYTEIYKVVGIDRAVSPRLLCSDAIVAQVQAGRLQFLAAFEEGAAKVCAAKITKNSLLAGQALWQAGFPKGCVVGAIQRTMNGGEKVVIPRGDLELAEGDNLIMFLLPSVEPAVYELLEAKSR